MSRKTDHTLPDAVAAALSRLGPALATGHAPSEVVAEAIAGLADLPPKAVTWADAKIAELSQLDRRHEARPSLLTLFRRSHTALELLDRRPELAPIFLFHRDGYVREAALDSLAVPPVSPFFLAAITLRLNDWVRPVRIAARRCAERLLPDTAAEVVAGAAPFLLDRWRQWGRWEGEDASVVDRALQRQDVADHLAEWFCEGATGPLATLLRYALRGPSLDGHLPRLASDALQPAVRAVALHALIDGRVSWPVGFGREWIDKQYGHWKRITLFAHRNIVHGLAPDMLIGEGLRDRSSAVRRVAADALIERRAMFPNLDVAVAALAMDASPALRARADFIVRDQARQSALKLPPGL